MRRILVGAALASVLLASVASAAIQVGAYAPNFFKNRLGGGTLALTDYPNKVVVLFLLGWS